MFIWACLTRSPMNHPLTPEGPLPTPHCICPTLLKVEGGGGGFRTGELHPRFPLPLHGWSWSLLEQCGLIPLHLPFSCHLRSLCCLYSMKGSSPAHAWLLFNVRGRNRKPRTRKCMPLRPIRYHPP